MSKKLFCDKCKIELIVPTVDNKIEIDESSTYKNTLDVSVCKNDKKEQYKFKFYINFEKQRMFKNYKPKSKDYMHADLCDDCKIEILKQIVSQNKE